VFRIIRDILSEIEKSIEETTLLKNFNMKVLPALHVKVIELAELLVNILSTETKLTLLCRKMYMTGNFVLITLL
jgi:hypothetical protein